jgi:hypothetical protein
MDDHDEFDYVTCPACGTEQPETESLVGTLGTLDHHRCRYCGARFYTGIEEDEE